jgi:hypothetical protein
LDAPWSIVLLVLLGLTALGLLLYPWLKKLELKSIRKKREISTGDLDEGISLGPGPDTFRAGVVESNMGWQAWLLVAQPAPRRRENREAGTSDQIYDEAQFEAYRALGEVAGESFFTQDIIEGWNAGNVDEWFKPLASNLLPDNDEVFSSRKKRPKLPRRDFASLGSAGGGRSAGGALPGFGQQG